MRLIALALPVLVVAGLATPAQGAPRDGGPPPSGWTSTGAQLVWRSPHPIPMGDARVEFWDGDRLLGRASPSPDMRTFTLTAPTVTDPHELQVRESGRRLDVQQPPQPATSVPVSTLPPLPAGAVDPGTPGPFSTISGEYALDPITLPGFKAPVEMQALVVAPKGVTGKRPLVLFLHGRHATCYAGADPDKESGDWPCPAGTTPVPSYRGFQRSQQLLASQGYLTVSISANGINGQDSVPDGGAQARSSLVRDHLAKWADWAGTGRAAAPAIVRDAPVADMSDVLLVGHSRGGEGVERAALDSLSPPTGDTGYNGPVRWTIRGVFQIGPTDFGQNSTPDVPSVTILPGCDGDVSDLEGEMYVDATRGMSHGTALHSALYVVGANHNFFNSEWTPGLSAAPSVDDAAGTPVNPVCSPGEPTRLTATQEEAVGATYVAAAAHLFLAGDQRVLPLLDGSGVSAPSAGPARVLSHAVGGARIPFVVPDSTTKADGSGRVCAQVTSDSTACLASTDPLSSPHFTPFVSGATDPDRMSVALQWSAAGQQASISPVKPVSLACAHDLALRIAVPPNTTDTAFDVAITDTGGRREQLGSVSLKGLPAAGQMTSLWAQEVRVPLPSSGIDLSQVATVELVPHSASGRAWLIDAYGWNPGLPDPHTTALPRLDVGSMSIMDFDSGTRTYQIPVTVTGKGPATARLFVENADGMTYSTPLVTIQPGQREIEVPMQVVGSTLWSWDRLQAIYVKAVQGTVAGGYVGGLTVLNDDPEPTMTITPLADHVTAGGTLTWQVTLSALGASPFIRLGIPLAPTDGVPELTTTDVDPTWFTANSGEDPLPSRPLSSTGLFVLMEIPAGQLTGEITVPTVAGTQTGPAREIRLHLQAYPPGGKETEVVGTVTGSPHA